MLPVTSVPVPDTVLAIETKFRPIGRRCIVSSVAFAPIVVRVVSIAGASAVTTRSSFTETLSWMAAVVVAPSETLRPVRSADAKPASFAVTA